MANIKSLKPFQKGHDPRRNTKGRPKGALSTRSKIKELIIPMLLEKVDGKDINKLELIIRRSIARAMQGDVRMVKLIMEYTDGKPPTYEEAQKRDRVEMFRQIEEKSMTKKQIVKTAREILKNSPKDKNENDDLSAWKGDFNEFYSDHTKRKST